MDLWVFWVEKSVQDWWREELELEWISKSLEQLRFHQASIFDAKGRDPEMDMLPSSTGRLIGCRQGTMSTTQYQGTGEVQCSSTQSFYTGSIGSPVLHCFNSWDILPRWAAILCNASWFGDQGPLFLLGCSAAEFWNGWLTTTPMRLFHPAILGCFEG